MANKLTPAARKAAITLAVVLGVVAVSYLVVSVLGLGDYTVANTAVWAAQNGGVQALAWLVPTAAVITGGVVLLGSLPSNDYYRSREADGKGIAVGGSLIAVAVLLFSLTIWWVGLGNARFSAASWWVQNVEDTTEAPGPYEERLNLAQARQTLTRSLGGVPGQLEAVTPMGGATTGLVEREIGGMGRRWTAAVVEVDEAGETRVAEFATQRVGTPTGMFGSRLGAQITEAFGPGLWVSETDRYGFIGTDGQANLVVPVYGLTGGLNYHLIPRGVVVFDADGNVRHLPVVNPEDGIPGPVLGESFAAQVREGLNARNGLMAFKLPSNNPDGLETTDRQGGVAAADPNSENVSEWIVRRADGRLVYVTPLTRTGSSRAVVAYLEVDADRVVTGEAPTARLIELAAPVASPQDVAQRVTTLYDADIAWYTANEGDDQNQVRIYEVIPTEGGYVTLTAGTGTQTLYRVRVDARITDEATAQFGEVCVEDYRSGALLRCDGPAVTQAGLGSLRGIADSTPAPTPPTGGTPIPVPDAGTVGTLSDEELRLLITSAADELARRAGAAG